MLSGAKGRAFESRRAHHLFLLTWGTGEAAAQRNEPFKRKHFALATSFWNVGSSRGGSTSRSESVSCQDVVLRVGRNALGLLRQLQRHFDGGRLRTRERHDPAPLQALVELQVQRQESVKVGRDAVLGHGSGQ